MKLSLSVALLTALALGCTDDGPRVRVSVAPVGSEFQLVTTSSGASATIPYTIRNDGDRAVVVGDCAVIPERLVNGQWEEDHTSICVLASSPATSTAFVELAPGGSLDAQTWAEHAGTFRLRVYFSVDAGETSARRAVSESFVVK